MTNPLQAIFEENLKYISQTELDASQIAAQFRGENGMVVHPLGEISCPTGRLYTADPLVSLLSGQYCPQLELSIPAGTYPVDIAILQHLYGVRMCTMRLKVRETAAVRYALATPTEESAVATGVDGVLAGFPVEAGMVTICDVETSEKYRTFMATWQQENPDKGRYEDYFAPLFAQSAKEFPDLQRQGGDFLLWNDLPMVASGFGDGFYQAYWGYDSEDTLCELVIPMVNPALFPTDLGRTLSVEVADKGVYPDVPHFTALRIVDFVAAGNAQFAIFTDPDGGFFQFQSAWLEDCFGTEMWRKLPSGKFRGVTLLSPSKLADDTVIQRGKFRQRHDESLTLDEVHEALATYYQCLTPEEFLEKVPHREMA